MSVVSPDSAKMEGYAVTGILFHHDGDRAIKQHFHIYGKGEAYIGCGKTEKDGRFYVVIRQPVALPQRVTLTFRLCQEGAPIHHPQLLKGSLLSYRKFTFYQGRTEVGETEESFVLHNTLIADVGEVQMRIQYARGREPLRYRSGRVPTVGDLSRRSVGNLDSDSFAPAPSDIWQLLKDGTCPWRLEENENFYLAEVDWSRYELVQLKTLANIRMFFKKKGSGDPELETIQVKFRKTKTPSSNPDDYSSLKVYRSSQSNFYEGLRIVGCSLHTYGQTLRDVYGSRVMLAAFDHLPGHPLGHLLFSYSRLLRECRREENFLSNSPLSMSGIAMLAEDALSVLDPFGFKPFEFFNVEQRSIEGVKEYVEILQGSVKRYLNSQWGCIKADWLPVHLFFEELAKGSPLSRSFDCVVAAAHVPLPGDREKIEQFMIDFIHRVIYW